MRGDSSLCFGAGRQPTTDGLDYINDSPARWRMVKQAWMRRRNCTIARARRLPASFTHTRRRGLLREETVAWHFVRIGKGLANHTRPRWQPEACLRITQHRQCRDRLFRGAIVYIANPMNPTKECASPSSACHSHGKFPRFVNIETFFWPQIRNSGVKPHVTAGPIPLNA